MYSKIINFPMDSLDFLFLSRIPKNVKGRIAPFVNWLNFISVPRFDTFYVSSAKLPIHSFPNCLAFNFKLYSI